MTVECISRIEETLDMTECHIVLVDNASPNGSGTRLKERYKGVSYCTVILNSENIGFARGNNVGYSYARERLNPDFIIVMNNDAFIEDRGFFDGISRIYEETGFHLLGPDIISSITGDHENPHRPQGLTKTELLNLIKYYKRELAARRCKPFYYFAHGGILMLSKTKKFIKRLLGIKPPPVVTNRIKDYDPALHPDPVLQGACLIYSKRFIEREPLAFNPNTFLFYEEDILNCYCRRKGYKTLYSSEIAVKHVISHSINKAISGQLERDIFIFTNYLNSATVLLNIMDEDAQGERSAAR